MHFNKNNSGYRYLCMRDLARGKETADTARKVLERFYKELT